MTTRPRALWVVVLAAALLVVLALFALPGLVGAPAPDAAGVVPAGVDVPATVTPSATVVDAPEPAPSKTPLPAVSSAPSATATLAVTPDDDLRFDGEQALGYVAAQTAFGPRPAGSNALRMAGDMIIAHLDAHGWQVETQEFVYQDATVRNIIARANVGAGPIALLGTHYDTRLYADQDADDPLGPVLGANDGGSGAAVLMELARVLETSELTNEVWLVFFDAEDNGTLNGWDWIVGSTYMANNLNEEPAVVVVVDMVGDSDQRFFIERTSTEWLVTRIWDTAASMGYADHFIRTGKYAIIDDHRPFLDRGIPAVDIIDFDYPEWHTTQDTLDKVQADSLQRVGRVLEYMLIEDLLTSDLPEAE